MCSSQSADTIIDVIINLGDQVMVISVSEMAWLDVFIPKHLEHRSRNDKQSDLVEREVASKPRA